MTEIIGNTFKDPKSLRKRLREAQYDHQNLERELIKHLNADKITMGQLKDINPNLRVCITAILYDGQSKGGKFTPVIFDNESDEDKDRTVLAVGRATSAAPTYFEASKMEDGKLYYDGGAYANNPSAWGVVLAATKVKLDCVRLISVGTGFQDIENLVKEPAKNDD